MKSIVFLLEEESTKAMLEIVLKRLAPDNHFIYITFSGKTDLDSKVEQRMKHYLIPDTYFIIIRDKDSANCIEVKEGLQIKCNNAGKANTSLIRIACHELESFYLGDLNTVAKAYELNIKNLQLKTKYRNPDNLGNPKEELKKITNNKYQPISGSRKIAEYLCLDGSNKSKSFNVLINGINAIRCPAS